METYFDAASSGAWPYLVLAIPAGMAILGALLVRFPEPIATMARPETSARFARLLGVFVVLFSSLWGAAFVWRIHQRQAEIAQLIAGGDLVVVEGDVADFAADARRDRFRLGTSWFEYRGAVDTGGFHQMARDGGPIANGRHVRVLADHSGRILKLDVSEPTAQ